MSFRATVNRVLRRLRETEISSDWADSYEDANTVTSYQKLICDLVNEVKREVEDAWNWTELRRTQVVNTVSGTRTYTLTGTNQRTRILSVVDQSDGYFLHEVSDTWIKKNQYPDQDSGRPSYYSPNGVSSGVLTVDLWAKPDAVYNIDFNIVDPQDDITSATGSITVLENIVILGAWARAIAERGEDGGALSDMAQIQYSQALADAIAIDAAKHEDEVTWNAS